MRRRLIQSNVANDETESKESLFRRLKAGFGKTRGKLIKLDGTARGGMIFSIVDEFISPLFD